MLAYRLLTRKGEWDVDTFLSTIPRHAMRELRIYSELEPWGFTIEDDRHAMLVAGVCHSKRLKPYRYQPPKFGPPRKMTPSQIFMARAKGDL